ncbi:hypothetical protein [Nostoc sp. WHI]|uniref:hypothetical protein n=1 Tax=Nostoc sp. WHI TaxID=2650611 RepID=UPI0018C482D1|nr:hypothetical protein [Nostoc sp. WHI]MBG1266618.1 hypothetical protein [Nostoc sp. WHI]
MNAEQELLQKWRFLTPDKQQQVLEFVEFLHLKTVNSQILTHGTKTQLGERLRQIRAKIVASGEPLLSQDEIEKEIASQRGGLQDMGE